MSWLESSFTVGMPHMVPDQLSEVELLKYLGDRQWEAISSILGVPPKEIVNDLGERLYASFINIEVDLGGKSLFELGEGKTIQVRHRARMYARRFVEGFLCFDDEEIPDSLLTDIESRDDLAKLGRPWVYLTNAFVTRETSNLKLRTFAPSAAGAEGSTEAKPLGIDDHEQVQKTGAVEFPGWKEAKPLPVADGEPVLYPIVPESDLNGAGLLYFARYVAIMNYGERVFLQRHLPLPVSSGLVRNLTTERRRIFYFGNADENDSVRIFVSARAISVDDGEGDSTTRCVPLKLFFETSLYRESDGGLMAKSVVCKSLDIPRRMKSVVREAGRLALSWGIGD